jgi:CsoR family transcriptional regulator, copper-sensing transcriptional repressor
VAKNQVLPIYEDQLAQDIKSRLSRIEGQVRGIARMAEEQRPCTELLEQLASVQAALRGTTRVVLRNYLERCVADGIRSGDSGIYDQLLEVITKFAK